MCNDLNSLSSQLKMDKLPLLDIKHQFQSNDEEFSLTIIKIMNQNI